MPSPILTTLPQARSTRAFRTFQAIVQSDPTVAPVVKFWDFQEGGGGTLVGEGFDFQFDAPPADSDHMPAVRCWYAGGGGNEWGAIYELNSKVNIGVRIWTPGTHGDDVMNLWAAIRHALWPRDDQDRLAVVDALWSSVPGFGSILDANEAGEPRFENAARNYLVAAGAFVINLRNPY